MAKTPGYFCRKCGLPWLLPGGCRCLPARQRGTRHPFCERCGAATSPVHSCAGPPVSYEAFIEVEGVKIAKGGVGQLRGYMDRHELLGTRGLVLHHWANNQWAALRRL